VASYLPLLNEIDRYEDRKRNVRIKANEFLPGLDFKSDASLNWDDEENYVDFDVDDVIANSRLELDLPINRWRQRNEYRDLIIRFEAGIRTLARNLDERRNVVANGIRNLERNRNDYLISVEAEKNTKARLDEQDIRSLAGTVNPQTYIDAQNDYIRAQNAVTDALVAVLSSKLDLQVNLGVLDASQERFWLDKKILESSTRVAEPKTAEEIQLIPPNELFKENENTN
jgi:outer membrane protein TolC